MTAIKEMKDILQSINAQCAKNESKEQRLQALNHVREFVQLHSGLKELSNDKFDKYCGHWESLIRT